MLLYDLTTHKCHSLNRTASRIWQECNGKRDIAEVAENLFGNTSKEAREELVILTLNELAQVNLIEEGKAYEFKSSVTRREMIKNVGKASLIALPLIASITAPKSISAQSGCLPALPCNPGTLTVGCPCDGTCAVGCIAPLSCNGPIGAFVCS